MATKTKRVKKSVSKKANQSVGVRELRQDASQILDLVKAGQVIEITEHGVAVAKLVPINKSTYEEYLEAGLIIPAANPDHTFDIPSKKLTGSKSSTQLLQIMRAE